MTGVGGLITKTVVMTTGAGGLVIKDITLAMVARVIVSTIGFGDLITRPLAPLVELPILVVCLKNFTCYTKYLKIFYI